MRLKNQLEVYSKQAFDSYMNLPQALTITTSYSIQQVRSYIFNLVRQKLTGSVLTMMVYYGKTREECFVVKTDGCWEFLKNAPKCSRLMFKINKVLENNRFLIVQIP